MTNGIDSPPIFWSNLDLEIVKAAPLETLLRWMLTAETKYQLPVPTNYTRMTVTEIRDWIERTVSAEIDDMGGISPGALKNITEKTKQEKKLQEAEDQLIKQCSKFKLTELGNSERLIKRYGKDLKYCPTFNKWHIWDGTYWKIDDTEEIVRMGKQVIRKIALESEYADLVDNDYKMVLKHSLSCETNGRIRAMISLAQSDVAVLPKDFDAQPNLFNCKNGTFDLGAWYFREHRKDDMLAMMSGVVYDPEAKCQLWIDHLLKIFNYDYDLLSSFQEMCGYSLLQENPEQLIFILYGEGKNGKSVTVRVLSEVMGTYSKNVSPESLMVRKYSETPRSDIARLVGARMITSTEAEDGMKFAESLIKQLTGGDKITVRRLYEQEFEFTPTFKIWFATNHKPKIRGTDTAIWRRILLIPFLVTIQDKDRDPDIVTKLLLEMPGIFNWCLEGLKRYKEHKTLSKAAGILAATAEYKKESNTLEEFFIDQCAFPEENHVGHEYSVGATEIYIAYKDYANANGDEPMSQTAFGKMMKAKDNVAIIRDTKGKRYVGIRLRI